MKKIITLLTVILIISVNYLWAQDQEHQDLLEELGLSPMEEEQHVKHHFGEMEPEANVFVGYRTINLNGLERAFEYEYPEDYPVLGGGWMKHSYPHSFHLDLNFNNEKDYMSDFRYSYKTLLNFQWSNTTLFHNLDNIELIDLNASNVQPGIIIKDRNNLYGVRSGINHLNFRLKPLDFPLHAYVRGLYVLKDGSQQQRSLLGSGFFNNLQRSTQRRNIDQVTQQYKLGLNSHLGPVELDLSHTEKRFDVDGDSSLFDTYTATATGTRPEGTFPHNQFSELKSSSNKIRIHTSYTGRIVASATLYTKERENRESGANEDIFVGKGSLVWTPLTRLSLFLNYAHKEIDTENPSTSSITDNQGSTTTFLTSVKPSVSSKEDTVSLTARYKPEKRVTLKGRYSYNRIARDRHELWNLQDSTRKNTLSFSANARIMNNFNFKTNFTHESVDKPSYNSEPYNSDRGLATLSWLLAPGINMLISYNLAREDRRDLSFTETSNAMDRDVRRDNLLGSATFQILNNLSLTTSYAYFRYKVVQDIVYEDLGGTELTDLSVPFEDRAHVYLASIFYVPRKNLNMLARVSHTRSTGDFDPGSQDLVLPLSVSSFSEYKARETVYHFSGDYECPYEFSCGLEIKYSDFDDVINNIHNSEQDGHGYLFILKLSKKWL